MRITTEQKKEFQETGFTVIKNAFDLDMVQNATEAFEVYVSQLANECNIQESEYRQVISQIRDLWKEIPLYRKLIFDSTLAVIASEFMDTTAARLLHDHIITKPQETSNEVPWHQDYPYWPTDHPGGLSCWLALDDVDENGGSLEVIPFSHREGECAPVDFIKNPRKDWENHPSKKKIAVKKGDLVVLHCLTWHKTGKNFSAPDRRAYISLWIPPQSRYAPKHSNWHPVNTHVSVTEGELLNEDWFPIVGNYNVEELKQIEPYPLEFYGPEKEDEDLSMFTASKLVKNRLLKLVEENLLQEKQAITDIFQYLIIPENRKLFVQTLIQRGVIQNANDAEQCLKELSINFIAFDKHQARNVYNEPYLQFKNIFCS